MTFSVKSRVIRDGRHVTETVSDHWYYRENALVDAKSYIEHQRKMATAGVTVLSVYVQEETTGLVHHRLNPAQPAPFY